MSQNKKRQYMIHSLFDLQNKYHFVYELSFFKLYFKQIEETRFIISIYCTYR